MRYYAMYNENNKLIAIGTGYGGTEITKEQYNALLTEIRAKADLVYKVYNGEITIYDVPTEWRAEVQMRVNELVVREETTEPIEREEGGQNVE